MSNKTIPVNYWLRPEKQVERKILIDAFHVLKKIWYDVSEYKYIWFWSTYYQDFLMFHKYLCITNMVCYESRSIPWRMELNKPYDFIELRNRKIEDDVWSGIDTGTKSIIRLDYEKSLDTDILDLIYDVFQLLCPWSIFLITINARFDWVQVDSRVIDKLKEEKIMGILGNKNKLSKYITDYKIKEIKQTLWDTILKINKSQLTSKDYGKILVESMRNKIQESILARGGDLKFVQLFNYRYSDWAPMVTIWGILESKTKKRKIISTFKDVNYINLSLEPLSLNLPNLTLKERRHLDSNLWTLKDWVRSDLSKEFTEAELENYIKFYKYYPNYQEWII